VKPMNLRRPKDNRWIAWMWNCPGCGVSMTAKPDDNETEESIRRNPRCDECEERHEKRKKAPQVEMFH